MNGLKISMFALLLVCAACAPALQPVPVHPRSLTGDWVADVARCNAVNDQLHAALDAAQRKELQGVTKHARRMQADSAAADGAHAGEGGHMGPYSWEMRDQKEQYQALFDEIHPVTEIQIVHQPGLIQFSSPSLAQRNFEPGTSSTLVTTFAHLRIESGWQNDEFVVHSKDNKTDIEITERYRLQQDGSLLLSVILSVKYMETQQYTLVYHRRAAA